MPSGLQLLGLGLYLAAFAAGTLGESFRRARRQPFSDRRIALNFGLGAAGSLVAALPWISAYAAAEFAEANRIGLFQQVGAPAVAIWLVAVVAISFQSYWMHRAYHHFGWLWAIHRVHHSDAGIDMSTGFRGHTLEYALDGVLAAAIVIALGVAPGVLLWALLAVQLPSLLSHANFALPEMWSRRIERVLVTPRVHLRHHSSARHEHDSNFGTSLSVWDRLFGTWHVDAPQAPLGLSAARA